MNTIVVKSDRKALRRRVKRAKGWHRRWQMQADGWRIDPGTGLYAKAWYHPQGWTIKVHARAP